MNRSWANIKAQVSKRDLGLFLLFYYVSTLIFYIATWIYYGAFEGGHPPFFHIQEYFASAGLQFFISFVLTLPIWYIVVIRLLPKSLVWALLSHLFFLPLYTMASYYLLAWGKAYFGWAFMWSGKGTVWTLYIIALFYLFQFGVIHAYVYHKKHQKALLTQVALKEAALNSHFTALKAQLNPHFLHNLFNSINATIPIEQEATRELIIQLSDLFRYQNWASQQDLVLLKDELAFIDNYLQLTKVRLKDRIEYTIKVDEILLEREIPPMLLQPLVENAVTHGISPKVDKSSLLITVQEQEDRLSIVVADTGIGIDMDSNFWDKGLGLTNTKARLKGRYNSDLKIVPNCPSGLKVSFLL